MRLDEVDVDEGEQELMDVRMVVSSVVKRAMVSLRSPSLEMSCRGNSITYPQPL